MFAVFKTYIHTIGNLRRISSAFYSLPNAMGSGKNNAANNVARANSSSNSKNKQRKTKRLLSFRPSCNFYRSKQSVFHLFRFVVALYLAVRSTSTIRQPHCECVYAGAVAWLRFGCFYLFSLQPVCGLYKMITHKMHDMVKYQ